MTTAPRPPGPPPGLVVGGYTLLSRLGEGGMGVVHLAQRPGGEPVALKVLRPHIVGDDEARARLAREVNSLSRIRSRRVAEIVDADPWGEIPFVATRYVPGLSLHDDVQQHGPVEGEDLVWLASCLAEALAAVHAVGVLHRDVKPSNVLMEGRTPILIDFGLARVADDPRLTHTGWLLGTPGYLAPEILRGEDATPASDVHSFAATVAFAGLGRPPFGRGPSMAILDRVRRGEHDLDGLDPTLGPLLDAALDPEPAGRPTLDELRAELDGRPAAPRVSPLRPESTRVLPVGPLPTARSRPGALERLRRVVLCAAGAAAGAAAVATAPYLALAGLVVLAWLLRSGSLAAGAAADRRRLRGVRWYDGPQLLLATPWHLFASIPGTLLLVAWSAGIAAAAALLAYAGSLSATAALGLVGLALVLSLWWGPGGSAVRGPVRRLVRPLSARPVAWFIATAAVLGVAAGLGAVAAESGPSWYPDDTAPLRDLAKPGWLP